MRHGKRGRKLGRTASHKKATMNNLATSLFMHGTIRTTRPKAKELRQVAERLITFAKRGDLHARRMVLRRIRNKVVVSKLFDEIGPSFAEREGGYTRVLNLGPRRGDATEVCLIELVGSERRADFADTASSTAVSEDGQSETDVEDEVAEEEVDVVEAESDDSDGEASEEEEDDETAEADFAKEADPDADDEGDEKKA